MVRRLAHPQLAPTIRELYSKTATGEDVRQLLMKMIWQGEITECADIALECAFDDSLESTSRLYGIKAVGGVGTCAQKQQLVRDIVANPSAWGRRLVGSAVDALHSDFLTVEDLLSVVERIQPADEWSHDSLTYSLERVCKSQPATLVRRRLLDGFVSLLQRPPYLNDSRQKVSSHYFWLLEYAEVLAEEELFENAKFGQLFFDSALIAIELHYESRHNGYYHHKQSERFNSLLKSNVKIRQVYFWRGVERCLAKEDKRKVNCFVAMRESPCSCICHDDFELFLSEISRRNNLDEQIIALDAAYYAWRDGGRERKGRDKLWRKVRGVLELEEKLYSLLHPGPMSAENVRWKQRERRLERQQARKEKKRRQERRAVISRLQEDVERLRHPADDATDAVWRDLYGLAESIRNKSGDHHLWGVSDWASLVPEFGQKVAEAARDGLMAYWRTYTPTLRSEQDSDGISYALITGLVGLSIESSELTNWANALSKEEAMIASRYATKELNGFPAWASSLFSIHCSVFESILLDELRWEICRPNSEAPPHHMLSAVRYGPDIILEKCRPIIFELVQEYEPVNEYTLENVFELMLQWNNLDKLAFSELAKSRYSTSIEYKRKLVWLVALACVDADDALFKFKTWLDEVSLRSDKDDLVMLFFTALVDHGSVRFGSVHRDYKRVSILREFVRLAYAHIRVEEDVSRRGMYTPKTRDYAESARSYFVNVVSETPGRESYDALISFSNELKSVWSRERMALLALGRAKADAEHEPWVVADVSRFAENAEKEPRFPRELFDLAVSRLDDLKFDLEDGERSVAAVYQRVTQETELRNALAGRLQDRSRGVYTVAQEEEHADATRTDIRFHNPKVDVPVPIELKIADNWPGPKLFERLENQLVGQYMRDIGINRGIYLLTYRGEKKRWYSADRATWYGFEELVLKLQDHANSILRLRADLEDIEVIGIDFGKRFR